MNTTNGPILIVEDIPNILELLAITLRFKGYSVTTARDGLEALDMIARERPALVVTDILMPKLDGFALAHRLLTDPRTRSIPVIFLSATFVTPEDKNFALNLGAKHFLEKPVDTEEFLLTVGEILASNGETLTEPMSERQFYLGYRDRLESKLRHKIAQISRTERLLQTLPPQQRPAFEALLIESSSQKDDIQRELNEVYQRLEELKEE
jgi:two-component system OmpR family response regulator